MLCKAIYNTRKDAVGDTIARVDIVADVAPPTLPTTGEGVEGLSDEVRIDDGSRLQVLQTGDAYAYGAGEWYKLQNASASGILEISRPGAYDVSGVAIVIVKEAAES